VRILYEPTLRTRTVIEECYTVLHPMQQLLPGVYSLPLKFEFMNERRTIHPAAIETDHGLVLIDVGTPDHVDTLESQLEEAGFTYDDVDTILLTHQDGDHAGGLSEVQRRSNALVVAHTDDAPSIDGRRDPIKGDERYPPAAVDIEVVDGVVFRTVAGPLRVVATPGHTPGHVSLYLPEAELLLAADALTAEDEFGGPNEPFTPNMDAAVESIGRLAALNVERTLCYHGGLVEHGADRIEAIHESLEG
jgi:glyoxylase-like metal-dependent hydrolase (beta-lactamase superfamily II)